MEKKFLVILLSAIIFLSCTVLGVSTVYRIEKVTVEASLVSEEAKTESECLQKELEELYQRDSIFFAGTDKAKSLLQSYPYFRITGFKKVYPNVLIFQIIEDAEVYAIEKTTGDGYYILGEDGTMLGERENPINPLTGAENVVLKNLKVTCQIGELPKGDDEFLPLLQLSKTLSTALGGIRSNVVSVEVYSRSPQTIYRVTMREGVKLYFGTPSEKTEEKVKEAVDKYMALTYEEKLTGRVVVSEVGGKIFASYATKDEFEV